MADYATVTNPEELEPEPMALSDLATAELPETVANVATDLGDGYATQLNCKYAGGKTFVIPIGGTLEPVKFDGYVSPQDVRVWYRAVHGPKEEAA